MWAAATVGVLLFIKELTIVCVPQTLVASNAQETMMYFMLSQPTGLQNDLRECTPKNTRYSLLETRY